MKYVAVTSVLIAFFSLFAWSKPIERYKQISVEVKIDSLDIAIRKEKLEFNKKYNELIENVNNKANHSEVWNSK